MNQSERRNYLIRELLQEEKQYQDVKIPSNSSEQKRLLRSLMNVRMPKEIDDDFLKIQDEYLQSELEKKKITDIKDLKEVQPDLYIWRGDITCLKCGAIVNAANSQMTGCYQPCHTCIDNCIHTYSGIQLRLKCADLMRRQGHEEPTGQAKITPAYNLPCDYVLHTVGPIIYDRVRKEDEELLASCYEKCLILADEYDIKSIAFCCISTGVFRFPNRQAAEIAIKTVKSYKEKTGSDIKVIFNVFKESDENFYRELLK